VVRDNQDALEQEACTPFVSHAHVRRVLTASGFRSLRELLAQPLGVPTEAFRAALTQGQLDELAEIVVGLPGFGRVTMTAAEIKGLTGPVEFGAHSVTHRSFALLRKQEIEFEVDDSAASISELTGKQADCLPFAYPYGAVTTYAERVVRRVCRAGFTYKVDLLRILILLELASHQPGCDGAADRTEGGPAIHLLLRSAKG
jgi:peptidoglycan/xylan/chitin deacetylase (PgdA/CDA1 family)